jgi:hypothetical protein
MNYVLGAIYIYTHTHERLYKAVYVGTQYINVPNEDQLGQKL